MLECNKNSNIKNVVGIASGKGGVGKSTVTVALACILAEKGYKVGILDADVMESSIPAMLGVKQIITKAEDGTRKPSYTSNGIKVVARSLMQEYDSDEIWDCDEASKILKMMWSEFDWGDLDFLLVDVPSIKGDVSPKIFKEFPLDAMIAVTTPQKISRDAVKRVISVSRLFNIKVVGIVENFSYYQCTHCGEPAEVFGESRTLQLGKELKTEFIAKIPILPNMSKIADEGTMYEGQYPYMEYAAMILKELYR